MTTYDPIYRLALYAPRSVDPDEMTVLTPVAGAPHALPFRIATKPFGQAVRIGATTSRYMVRNPVGTWPTSALTVEFWGRLDAGLSLTQPNFAFSYGVAGQFNEILIGLQSVSSTWRLYLERGGIGVVQDADAYPNDNAWHHVLMTWQSSDGATRLYLDGALVHSGTVASGNPIDAGGAVVLGQEQDSLAGGFDATQAWKGEMDQVRVYTRYITDQEVKEHFGGVYRDETGLCLAAGFDLPWKLGHDEAGLNELTPVGIDAGTTDTILRHQPYLLPPSEGRRGRVDVRNKRSDVGVMFFDLADPQLAGSDPLARFLPAYIGDLKGQLRIGGLMARVWESLDSGLTWRGFHTGRVRTVGQSETPAKYTIALRELADDLKNLAFVGRPHSSVTYAGFATLLPVAGAGVAFGDMPVAGLGGPLTGTIQDLGFPGRRVIILDQKSRTRRDNLITSNLLSAANVGIDEDLFAREFGSVRARVKVVSSSAVGHFLATISTMGAHAPASNNKSPSEHYRVGTVGLGSLSPQGVATGTPLANGAASIGATSVNTDGWTISITSIVRAGDIVKFTGHGTYYTVTADANSDGSGRATLSIAPVLTANVADNEGLSVVGETGGMSFPAVGAAVEFWLESQNRATDDTPLVIGDVHPVTLWRHLLEGLFGFLWTPTETLPPGRAYGDPRVPMAYNAAKFTELENDPTFMPLRFVVTERQPRGEFIEDHILRAANLAFYFDGDGAINPVNLRTPSDLTGVPTVTDVDLVVGITKPWEYDRSSAITRVDAAYYTDVVKTKVESLEASPDFFPTQPGVPFESFRHTVSIIDLGRSDLGDEPFDLDLTGFRAFTSESANGQPRTTYLQQQLYKLSLDTARPFGVGCPTTPLAVKRGSVGDVMPGTLLKTSIRSMPDPATNKLGGLRLVRVTSRKEKKTYVEIKVMDLGSPTIAGIPTIAAPAQETGNNHTGVTITVTLNGNNDPVEAHYAITDTSVGSAPAEASALWTPIVSTPAVAGVEPRYLRQQVLVRAAGAYSFRGLAPGKRVWIRGRSFPDARVNFILPSVWVAANSPGRVDLAALPVIANPVVSRQTAHTFRVSWEVAKNWILRSEEIDNAYWTKTATTVTPNAQAAPNGQMTADTLLETAVTSGHSFNNVGNAIAITSGESLVVSGFGKNLGGRLMILIGVNGSDAFLARFNLATGAIDSTGVVGAGTFTSAAIYSIGNGWYWCVAIGKINGGHTQALTQVSLDDGSHAGYLGDITKGAHVWGLQMERSAAANPYIKTVDAPAVTQLPIEILAATPTGDARVVVARVAGGSTLYDFPGDTDIILAASTTYRIELRHYLTAPDYFGGGITVDATTTSTDPVVADKPFIRPWIWRPFNDGLF